METDKTHKTDRTDGTREGDEPAVSAEQVIRIAEHYHKAQRKHPYFTDRLFWAKNQSEAVFDLNFRRNAISSHSEKDCVCAEEVLDCEVKEAAVAFVKGVDCSKGDKAAAVGELYDAIAVLLRMVDVIEGRQKLGKTKEAK